MNSYLSTKLRTAQRIVCTMLVIVLSVFGVMPMLQPKHASAAQFTNRYIKLSDSGYSGGSITSGVGSGDNVTYEVSFDAISTTDADGIVIDFCSDSPLINSTCTAPTGLDASSAALGATAVAGHVNSTDWTVTASASQIKLASDNGAGHHINASTETFDLSGITNPDSTDCAPANACAFYARIYTFDLSTWGTYASATSAGNYLDFGGIALTTTETISITARVQEQLTFCVTSKDQSLWSATDDCSDPVVTANPPAVILGHGSPVELLDANTVDMSTIYSQLSTNATNGAVIRMRNSNTSCGGLSSDGGTTCSIPATNSGSNAGAAAITAGTAAFGLFVAASSTGPGGTGSLTPSTVYYNASHVTVPTDVWFGMDTTTAGANVTSEFGSTICDTTTPVYRVNSAYTFAATSALTTPAGIYTANLSMIATGTF